MSAPSGARISRTMIVMMTAITPSLKASIRDFVNQRLVARRAGGAPGQILSIFWISTIVPAMWELGSGSPDELSGTCRQLRPRQVEDGLLRHGGVHRAAQPANRVQRGRVDAQAVQERLRDVEVHDLPDHVIRAQG